MGYFKKLFGGTEPEAHLDPNALYAPLAGKVVPLSEVPDPAFADELLGRGVAIWPTTGKVVAPCDATVDTMFDSGHAVSLISRRGAEILIHVGLETVGLGGRHYAVKVQPGDKVKKGQVLLEFDLKAVEAEGYKTVTPVVVCNSDDYADVIPRNLNQHVEMGTPILELKE